MTSTNDQLGTILQTQGRNFFLVRNADDRISNPEVNQHKVANLRSIVRVYSVCNYLSLADVSS